MSRPRSSVTARLLSAATIVGLVAAWAVVAVYWSRLPAQIPQHFGDGGVPDAWGGRSSALLGPGVATVIIAVLVALGRYQPPPMRRLLQVICTAIAVIVAWLTLQHMRVAVGEIQRLF